MPESPLVQKEAVALSDLEALIADRAKRESETELGFRKRIEREETEYKAIARQLAAKYKVDNESLEAQYARARDEVIQTFQRDTQACKAEYAQAKKQIDEQFKKDHRRAKKAKEETGWQALAFFEGSKEEGVKWRRGADANWHAALDELHLKKDTAEFVLGRCGRLAANLPDAVTPGPSETPAASIEPAIPAVDASSEATDPGATPEQPEDKSPLGSLAQDLRPNRRGIGRPRGPQAPQVPADGRIRLAVSAAGRGHHRGVGLGTPVGWMPAAIVGVVAGLGAGIGAYIALAKMARPAVLKHAVPLKAAITEADQLVEQNKDWVKTSSRASSSELDEGRVKKVQDAEEEMARRVAEFQSRQQKQTEDADKLYPAKLEDIRRIHDEAMKKVEEQYPPRIAALKEKYEKDRRQVDESYQQTKATTQEQYKQTWDKLIKDWTEGMARINGVVERRSRRSRPPVSRVAQARSRRLEAADRGPARSAFWRFQRRPRPVSRWVTPRPPAQVGANPVSSCPPSCPFPFRARC